MIYIYLVAGAPEKHFGAVFEATVFNMFTTFQEVMKLKGLLFMSLICHLQIVIVTWLLISAERVSVNFIKLWVLFIMFFWSE